MKDNQIVMMRIERQVSEIYYLAKNADDKGWGEDDLKTVMKRIRFLSDLALSECATYAIENNTDVV